MSDVTFIVVPKGSTPGRCRGQSCGRDDIYFVERRSTARKYAAKPESQRPMVRMPVDCAVEGGQEPDSFADGRGVSHFTTCPDSRDF